MSVATDERKPFTVHCRDCKHEWAAFYFPLVMDKAGQRLMRNAAKSCPMCAGSKIYCGPLLSTAPSDKDSEG